MPKLVKSSDHGHKLISSGDGQDTSACEISGHSLHAFSGKCPETSPDGRTDGQTDGRTDGRTDGHAVKRLRLVGWTNGPMYRSKEGISGFGRTDGRTDGQPENIMPPAPKGGGIKTSKLRLTGLYEGNPPVTDAPHKKPITQKTFPFDDVIMIWDNSKMLCCTKVIKHDQRCCIYPEYGTKITESCYRSD